MIEMHKGLQIDQKIKRIWSLKRGMAKSAEKTEINREWQFFIHVAAPKVNYTDV